MAKAQCLRILGLMPSVPIALLGSRPTRALKTSESVMEMFARNEEGEGKLSGLGVGKELLVKIEWK